MTCFYPPLRGLLACLRTRWRQRVRGLLACLRTRWRQRGHCQHTGWTPLDGCPTCGQV